MHSPARCWVSPQQLNPSQTQVLSGLTIDQFKDPIFIILSTLFTLLRISLFPFNYSLASHCSQLFVQRHFEKQAFKLQKKIITTAHCYAENPHRSMDFSLRDSLHFLESG